MNEEDIRKQQLQAQKQRRLQQEKQKKQQQQRQALNSNQGHRTSSQSANKPVPQKSGTGRREPSPQPQQMKRKPPVSFGKAFMLGLLASFIMCLVMSGLLIGYAAVNSSTEQSQQKQMLEEQQALIERAASNVSLSPTKDTVSKAVASTANIAVTKDANGTAETVYGAGVVISATGDILTNSHVVADAKSISVEISGTKYEAEMIGEDLSSDLSVIRAANAKNLVPATIGKSSDLIQGDWVMAIGNPFGLSSSLTAGNVSALGRDLKYDSGNSSIMYANMIQVSAAMNPGNSGGGLYDSTGALLGITTVITSQTGENSGIGYAIPADYAIPLAKSLVSDGKAQHAVLGVSLSKVPADTVTKYGLPSSDGAYISEVVAAGPAANAGITVGDIITSFNGTKIKDDQDLLFKVRALPVNTQVEVKVLREGKEMSFNIKLGSDV